MKNRILLLIPIIITLISIYGFELNSGRDPGSKPDKFYSFKTSFSPGFDNSSGLFIQQSFEDTLFPPPGWRKYNPDAGTGWIRVTAGTSPLPGWNGGIVTTPPGGGIAAAYCTWSTGGPVSNDQWLVTPQITNVGFEDSLVFWVQCPRYSNIKYGDSLIIMVSTTTPAIQSFTKAEVLSWTASSPDTLWNRKSFRLANFPGVNAGSNIYIAFREIAYNNNESGASLLLDLVEINGNLTNLQSIHTNIPDKLSLSQNYPNPFNPSTRIEFNIPKSGFVSLKVYDILGREVANLVNKELSSGNYSYEFNGSQLNSGIYFYALKTENTSLTKKMILTK
jgi:hypothetical protein